MTEISEYAGIERTAVSRMISRLENQGYVQREKSVHDGRASTLTVTPLGDKICETIPDRMQSATAKHLLDLSPNQIRQLADLLDLIQPGDHPIWSNTQDP